MRQQPDDIVVANLEVIIMPQGDIISNGKILGQFKEFKKYLTLKVIK